MNSINSLLSHGPCPRFGGLGPPQRPYPSNDLGSYAVQKGPIESHGTNGSLLWDSGLPAGYVHNRIWTLAKKRP